MGEHKNQVLLNASEKGDILMVTKMLDYGADINTTDVWYDTPLIIACTNNHSEIVAELLSRGADINETNVINMSAIDYAISREQIKIKIIELLLKYNANIRFQKKYVNEWAGEDIQELIINTQPHNIKLLDDNVGILPHLKQKYKDIIELAEMGLI